MGAAEEQVSARRSAWELWRELPRARPYLRPYRRQIGAVVGLTIASALIALAEPWPLAVILSQVLRDNDPSGLLKTVFGSHPDVMTVVIALAAVRLLLIVAGNAVTVLSNYLGSKAEQYMVLDLRSDLFDHCQRLSLTFHDQRQTGALMSQINLQAASVGNIVMVIPPVVEAILTLAGMLVIAWLIEWKLAVLALIVVPFLYWSFGMYGKRIVPRLERVQQLEWRSLSIVHEAMAMLRVIVSFGREGYEHRRFREQGKTAVEERVRLTVSQSVYTLAVQTMTAVGTCLVLGFGAWEVVQGRLTVGELIVVMSYIASVYQPLEQISTTVGTVHEQLVQFRASMALLDTEPEVKEAPDAVEVDEVRGYVAARGVSFSYTGRRDTLRDISFEVRPGETVAIVGPTGAGKTTLTNLLIRFFDPQAGTITLDGIDIAKLTLRSLREQFSVVLQEPLLFSGTIAENIRYGRLDASQDDVEKAARAANAHDFVAGLPKGYDTVIGERGAQLSGGERQRIAVARAFLKDAPILILDEPTSSIDSRTEGVILDALDDLMAGRTSFMVAHRLSTVRHADQILVLDRGRIVERGTHAELLAHGGLYRALYEAQRRERRGEEAVEAAEAEDERQLATPGEAAAEPRSAEVVAGPWTAVAPTVTWRQVDLAPNGGGRDTRTGNGGVAATPSAHALAGRSPTDDEALRLTGGDRTGVSRIGAGIRRLTGRGRGRKQ
jgi:ABC-type multidrug transport system fused ATPase/permease subunit